MAVTIGICTSARRSNIEKLLSTLMSLHLPMINFKMVDLPYNDLDSYQVEQQGLDGLILCHSIHNRRFAITDVMDALYDTFLPRARRFIGKENVAVIVHDFDWPYRQGWMSSTMDTFQKKQPTAVACSSLVILCGKLDNSHPDKSIEMDEHDRQKLLEYASAVQPYVSIIEAVSCRIKSAISFFVQSMQIISENVSGWDIKSKRLFIARVSGGLCIVVFIVVIIHRHFYQPMLETEAKVADHNPPDLKPAF